MSQTGRPVSSSISIRGALITETYRVFQMWDFTRSKTENLMRVRAENVTGSGSEKWLGKLTRALSLRFDPNGVDRPLVDLAKGGCSYEIWNPLLLWHMTRTEMLLRDFLSGWLYQHYLDGTLRLRTEDVVAYIKSLPKRKEFALVGSWSETTIARVSSGLLKIAVDFGLMTGKLTREFLPYHLPEKSFLYLLHAIAAYEPSARRIVNSSDWQMYLMSSSDVERELLRLHQFHQLHYEVAGSLAQLKLPFNSSAEYAQEVLL
jgi:hypothetical protein